MGVKQDRKLDELSVDGPAFQSALEQATKRQAARINLRAMIDQSGAALRDVVIRPGEIQRMAKDYRDTLRAKGDPGADEQAAELEAMLVEIRRRVEEGTLRFSRKATAKGTADTVSAPSKAEIAGQAGDAGAAKQGEGEHGGAVDGQSGSSGEGDGQPEVTAGGKAAPQQAGPEGEPAGSPEDGEGQERSEAPILPPGPETGEPEGDDPYDGGGDPDDGGDEDGKPGPGANGWPNRGGPDGKGDRYAD